MKVECPFCKKEVTVTYVPGQWGPQKNAIYAKHGMRIEKRTNGGKNYVGQLNCPASGELLKQ